MIKTCSTCAHSFGSSKFGECALEGFYRKVVMAYPISSTCKAGFEGWSPIPGLLQRIFSYFWNKV